MTEEGASCGTPEEDLHSRISSQIEAGFRRRDAEHVSEVFERYKSPGTCGVPASNLVSALQELGIYTDADGVTELLDTHDLNSDGVFDSAEFKQILARPSQMELWAISLPLAQILADCMPPRVSNKNTAEDQDALRALSNLSTDEIDVSTECFRQGLKRLLTEQFKMLRRAYEEVDQKMTTAASQSQESSKFAVVGMSCGGIEDFRGGLNERVGDPSLEVRKAMEAEHCDRKNSKTLFTTRNYNISTCPYNEWNIVVNGNHAIADMRSDRKVPDIDTLCKHEQAQAAKLIREEVIVLVLYTGPMFEVYNCVLRQFPKDLYKELTQEGNAFTTTIHALVSAVQKLSAIAKVPDGLKLYRGLGAVSDLPEHFRKPHKSRGRGFTEWGFMSTTSDKEIAIFYTKGGYDTRTTLPMVLEVTVGAVDRGACIADFSQYPKEVEYLFVFVCCVYYAFLLG